MRKKKKHFSRVSFKLKYIYIIILSVEISYLDFLVHILSRSLINRYAFKCILSDNLDVILHNIVDKFVFFSYNFLRRTHMVFMTFNDDRLLDQLIDPLLVLDHGSLDLNFTKIPRSIRRVSNSCVFFFTLDCQDLFNKLIS